MKKKKEKVTSNDVLDALSIRINDVLKTTRKGTTDKTNSAYFWLFKLILLILYIGLIIGLFDATCKLGVSLIYFFGKSLRSILAFGWQSIIGFTKGITILYLIYSNAVTFTESAFYKKLYHTDKPMEKKKDNFFAVIKVILKAISVVFLVILGLLAAISVFATVIFIKLLLDGVYIISPIIICLSTFALCYLAFKSIQRKFFDTKPAVSHNSIILAVIALVIGVAAFAYETSGYEYKNGLPIDFETIKKVETFDVSRIDKINITADTRLRTIRVLIDNELKDEIRLELEYFETADVSYIYRFNEDDDLDLEITSKLNFKFENLYDIAKLGSATLNNSTIYNYNLFKYPNITIYVNENTAKKITTSNK